MKNFILIDYLTESLKRLAEKLKNHTHDEYIRRDEIKNNFFFEHPNVISEDLKINEGNNAVFSGPLEIKGGKTLEIPKGSVITII